MEVVCVVDELGIGGGRWTRETFDKCSEVGNDYDGQVINKDKIKLGIPRTNLTYKFVGEFNEFPNDVSVLSLCTCMYVALPSHSVVFLMISVECTPSFGLSLSQSVSQVG